MAFYEGGDYPDEYDGALFFSDYFARLHFRHVSLEPVVYPPPTPFNDSLPMQGPVNLEIGPDGDLFYVDIIDRQRGAGPVHRRAGKQPEIQWLLRRRQPPNSGEAPLES